MSEEVMLSVVMTTYNHERYIAEAIESVFLLGGCPCGLS